MKTLLKTFLTILVLFVLALAAELIVPLKQLTVYLEQHPDPYRLIAVVIAVIGWILMIGVFVYLLVENGTSMPEGQARQFAQSGTGQSPATQRVFGRATGREFYLQVTFREIKDAVRSGAWVHQGRMWAILIGILALALIAYGMFGYFFVIGPPLVKLLCAGALVYATLRTLWGFWLA